MAKPITKSVEQKNTFLAKKKNAQYKVPSQQRDTFQGNSFS
jgi:hypothetical protein